MNAGVSWVGGGLGLDTGKVAVGGWFALLLLGHASELFLLNRKIGVLRLIVARRILILRLLLKLRLLMRSVIGRHGAGVVLSIELLPICRHGSVRSLGHYRHHLSLGVCAPDVGIVEVDHVVLDVLGFVDDSHVLKVSKKSVCFTVSIIKELVIEPEVLQSLLIREVQINGSLGFNELCHACQLRLHVVQLLLDRVTDSSDFVLSLPIFTGIRRVSVMVGAMLLLMLNLASHTQSFLVSHAEVSDLLVVFAAKADWILVSSTIHGLLVILIPLAVQILLHNDYALSVEIGRAHV